jgi:hypothetical protein
MAVVLARLLRAFAAAALAVPQTGCIGFLIGYEMGSAAGRQQCLLEAERSGDVERAVEAATTAVEPSDRVRALRTLARDYRSPPRFDPSIVRSEADARVVRIAETLDDPDARVRETGRSVLRLIAGDQADLREEDLARLEAPPPAPDQSRPDDSSEREGARRRLADACLRAYALARLGDPAPPPALLRRALAALAGGDASPFEFDPATWPAAALLVLDPSAPAARASLLAIVGRAAAHVPQAPLPVYVDRRKAEAPTDWPPPREATLAAVIALSRAGAPEALPALRTLSRDGDFVTRTAAARAVERIAAKPPTGR